uniref:hepatoma-derived growth factor-related protein 2-like isoform X2 n=1 Tax=Doryrhamphus excisus TaxID=161450 RepID=UPI0025AE8AEA|nr:hepatoma-derived growth factor-related protein 2-like isoform X2 [Doryrhamphus excisus]
MPGKTCHQFKPGDLVFGKMKGFPHWPARVCKSDDAHKKRVPVFFFGTHQIGHLLPENIVPFSGNKLKYGSGVRIKGFSEGMWEIQNTPGVGSKSKMPSKTTPAKSTAASKAPSPDKPSAARSTPSKRTSTAKSTLAVKTASGVRSTHANLNEDANSTPVKPEPDAETSPLEETSNAEELPSVSTVDLMECMVKCVPPQTSNSVSSAKSQKEANLSKVDYAARRSLSRSATQTPTDDLLQKDSSPKDGTTAGRQRRGRPSKGSKGKNSKMTQAAESQTPPSGEHGGCAVSMVHCMVKSHGLTEPATGHKEDAASEPMSSLTRSTSATKTARRSSRSTAQSPTEDLPTPQKHSTLKDNVAAEGRKRGRPAKVSVVKKSMEDPAGPLISHMDPQSHDASDLLPKTYDHMTQSSPVLTRSSSMDGQKEKEPQDEKMPEEDPMEKIWSGEEKQQMEDEGNKELSEESTTRREVERKRNEDEVIEKKKELVEEKKQRERMPEEEQKEVLLGEEKQKEFESAMSRTLERKVDEEKKELEDKSTASRGVKRKTKEKKKEPEEKRTTTRGGRKRQRKNDEGNKELEEEQKQLEGNQRLEEEKELSEESPARRGVERKRDDDEIEKKQLESTLSRGFERKMEEQEEEKQQQQIEGEQKELEDKSTASSGLQRKRKEEKNKEPDEKRKQVEEEQKILDGTSAVDRGVKRKTEDEEKKRLKKEQELDEKSTASREVKRKRKEEKKKESGEEQKELGEESTTNREGKRKDKTNKDPQEQRRQVDEEHNEQKVLAQDLKRGIQKKRKEAEIQQEGSVEGKTEEPMTAGKQSKRRRSEEGVSKSKREKEAAEESQKDERKKEDVIEDRRGARRKSRKEKSTKGREAHEEGKNRAKKERHVDEERRLAAKRESVLKSLRGLLKESPTKSTKSTGRAKKAARSHKMLKESMVGRKGVKVGGSQLPVKEAKKDHEETQSKKLSSHSDGGKVMEKTQPDERKLIGKIVKATTKVHVKTMMGGAAMLEEQRKKTLKADVTKTQKISEDARKPERPATDDKSAKNSGNQGLKTKLRDQPEDNQGDRKKGGDKTSVSEKDGNAAAKLPKEQSGGRSRKQTPAATMHSGEGAEHNHQEQEKNSNLTLIDSTLHRIHGDIRISLKSDNPDVSKCLAALDQLSGIYLTSQHVQRHSELVSTLRKMRFYRANQDIMDKAAMLYNRFKNAFLLGEDQEVVSAAFLRSLLEEKEREKAVHSDGCEETGFEQKRLSGEEPEFQRKESPSVD